MNADLCLTPLVETNALIEDEADLSVKAANDGYLFFRGVIDASMISALRARVIEYCEAVAWTKGGDWAGVPVGNYKDEPWIGLQQAILPSREFAELIGQRVFAQIAKASVGEAEAIGAVCRVFSPGSDQWTTPPHQDGHYLRDASSPWTVWVPLVDCPLELGGLALLPGSHRAGLLPHLGEKGELGADIPQNARWAHSHYQAGDVVAFSCFTVHRALDNRTKDRLRISVDFRYVRPI